MLRGPNTNKYLEQIVNVYSVAYLKVLIILAFKLKLRHGVKLLTSDVLRYDGEVVDSMICVCNRPLWMVHAVV